MTGAVAVAVNNGGNGRGNGSRRAVKWAVENLWAQTNRFILVHVMPIITHIPTPSGDRIDIEELDTKVVAKYKEDVRAKAKEIFIQYKRLCKSSEVEFETLLLEYDSVTGALVDYAKESRVRSIVMGSESTNRFWSYLRGLGWSDEAVALPWNRVKLISSTRPSITTDSLPLYSMDVEGTSLRKFKGTGIPQIVLRSAPGTCDVFVVSKRRVKTKLATSMTSTLSISTDKTDATKLPIVLATGQTPFHSSSSIEPGNGVSWSEFSPPRSSLDQHDLGIVSLDEKSRSEARASYEQVELLSSECGDDVNKINAATEREEASSRKHLQAEKEAKAVQDLMARESYNRQISELKSLRESRERRRVVEEIISSERGTRRYTLAEIENVTDCFSENKVIGEGGYGKVYRGVLDHTAVAIKVLRPDATDKKDEFLREVEILSQLRHPNIVLLQGVCPDMGCLVYEYMENGSLDEHIFRHNGKPSLPWFARFRIALEIASGLAFLHSNKPHPIVHRDIKPGNILIGRNYVSKISDVGLAKLLSDNIPDSVTMFGNSLLAGTLYYIDPEYQRTGTVRAKSDLYSFGMIILQLLTARHPNGLLLVMENAIASGTLSYILDDSIKDWPLCEAEELTRLALECCKLRSRDRPDLESVVLPVLKKLGYVADARRKVETDISFAPRHYLCPILGEIMEDPHVAADGFTYERRAIQAWLNKHELSPVTKKKLSHLHITPNTTLLNAIQQWRSMSYDCE